MLRKDNTGNWLSDFGVDKGFSNRTQRVLTRIENINKLDEDLLYIKILFKSENASHK